MIFISAFTILRLTLSMLWVHRIDWGVCYEHQDTMLNDIRRPFFGFSHIQLISAIFLPEKLQKESGMCCTLYTIPIQLAYARDLDIILCFFPLYYYSVPVLLTDKGKYNRVTKKRVNKSAKFLWKCKWIMLFKIYWKIVKLYREFSKKRDKIN